jgi:hypothetical protein
LVERPSGGGTYFYTVLDLVEHALRKIVVLFKYNPGMVLR